MYLFVALHQYLLGPIIKTEYVDMCIVLELRSQN